MPMHAQVVAISKATPNKFSVSIHRLHLFTVSTKMFHYSVFFHYFPFILYRLSKIQSCKRVSTHMSLCYQVGTNSPFCYSCNLNHQGTTLSFSLLWLCQANNGFKRCYIAILIINNENGPPACMQYAWVQDRNRFIWSGLKL